MADDVVLNSGSGGETLATDQAAGGEHYQQIKIVDGTADATTPIIAGGGVEASALLVTLANDSTGLLSVDDNGGSLTIDGTVTANLSATDNAVLDTIDAVLDLINAKLVTGTVIGDVNLGATDNAVLDDIAAQVTTVAGAVSTEMQVDVVASLPAGTNGIGKLTANSGVDIGDVDVTSISAGTNLVGDVGISGARTSGGTTLYKNIDVDESEDQVKGTAGQVYWIHAMNLTAAVLYLKIYNATAASVTVGTTVPDLTFPLATSGDTNGAGFSLVVPNGIAFGTAISIAATTGIADNDSGAPGANAVVVNLGYA